MKIPISNTRRRWRAWFYPLLILGWAAFIGPVQADDEEAASAAVVEPVQADDEVAADDGDATTDDGEVTTDDDVETFAIPIQADDGDGCGYAFMDEDSNVSIPCVAYGGQYFQVDFEPVTATNSTLRSWRVTKVAEPTCPVNDEAKKCGLVLNEQLIVFVETEDGELHHASLSSIDTNLVEWQLSESKLLREAEEPSRGIGGFVGGLVCDSTVVAVKISGSVRDSSMRFGSKGACGTDWTTVYNGYNAYGGLSQETCLDQYANKYGNDGEADLMFNGCTSTKNSSTMRGFRKVYDNLFYSACQQHDYCYFSTQTKSTCDKRFYAQMTDRCGALKGSAYSECILIAKAYYQAMEYTVELGFPVVVTPKKSPAFALYDIAQSIKNAASFCNCDSEFCGVNPKTSCERRLSDDECDNMVNYYADQYGERIKPVDMGPVAVPMKEEVCFYEHKKNKGKSFCVDTLSSKTKKVGDIRKTSDSWFNDKISAMEIKLPGLTTVVLWEHNNFTGKRKSYSRSIDNLHGKSHKMGDKMTGYCLKGSQSTTACP